MEEVKKEQIGIVVDDGTVEVPITNLTGKQVGVFYFRPTDINILKRYNDVVEKIGDVAEPLVNANINTDGKGEDAESIEIVEQAEKRLYELMDYLFDGNYAEAFFGSMNPYSPIGGRFYAEVALEAVGNYISDKFNTELKNVSDRMKKHTHGYRTGKHKKGKQ